LAFSVLAKEVMRDCVAVTSRFITLELDRALAIEVVASYRLRSANTGVSD
jgi:hypothetical protein